MKNTALNDIHVSLGAKMVEFAGYNMPVQYEGVKAEHLSVRSSLGVFDVSHMGEFFVSGKNSFEFLQSILSNDLAVLANEQAQYTCLPNEKNGIVDDLIVYKFSDEKYMLVVNASNIEKDLNWINSKNNYDVSIKNESEKYSLLAIQGPKAIKAMQALTSIDLNSIAFYHFKQGLFAGFNDVIISATGYTGSGGFEIYCKNEQVNEIWRKVFEVGQNYDIKPIGLAARDTLRLEMGYCLYGNDINESTSTIEAGLSWITKFTKEFTNSKYLKNEKETGPKRKLVAFETIERGIPRKDYEIYSNENNKIGIVTSGTMSPSFNKGIGMGYVETSYSKIGAFVFIKIREKLIKSKIIKLPFKA
ncbi:glycine cleavage system aminomethyltransferase GcvT [Flavobacteriaceae bacterium]|nr:glycine cleavage system aminomethyltransferase GcvT [Flavobacteriaceae bacterium]MDC1491828.1 glycine cleavage system aminomethyltransferase GcvT [Flavobacteriaceae bacterium]